MDYFVKTRRQPISSHVASCELLSDRSPGLIPNVAEPAAAETYYVQLKHLVSRFNRALPLSLMVGPSYELFTACTILPASPSSRSSNVFISSAEMSKSKISALLFILAGVSLFGNVTQFFCIEYLINICAVSLLYFFARLTSVSS